MNSLYLNFARNQFAKDEKYPMTFEKKLQIHAQILMYFSCILFVTNTTNSKKSDQEIY